MNESIGCIILSKLTFLAQSIDVRGAAVTIGLDFTPALFAAAALSICASGAGNRPDQTASASAEATNDLFNFLIDSDLLQRIARHRVFPPEPACAATETAAGEFWNLAALIQNVFEHVTEGSPGLEQVVSMLTKFQARQVYDLGSGAGHLAFALARSGITVTCTDRNAVARQFLRYRRSKRGFDTAISFRPGSRQYDAITAIQVLDHLADPGGVITCLARRLRPGGLILASASFANDGWHTSDSQTLSKVGRHLNKNFVYRISNSADAGLLRMVRRSRDRPRCLSRLDANSVCVWLDPTATFVQLPNLQNQIAITSPHRYVTPLVVTENGVRLAQACYGGITVTGLLDVMQDLRITRTEVLLALRHLERAGLVSIGGLACWTEATDRSSASV
jgi:SAM-dependent methyltransferase